MDTSSPADHRDCQRLQHLRSGAKCEGQRQHAADGRHCRHHDRTQPPLCRMQHRLTRRRALSPIVLVRIQQQDAVLRHDADDHDQAHERRHVEVRAA